MKKILTPIIKIAITHTMMLQILQGGYVREERANTNAKLQSNKS